MSRQNALKVVHLASTIWFTLSAGYILVFALRQAGINWWVVFSLSGYSVLLISLLVSLYLFAIFRGAGESQKIETEHPLTTTNYYMMFYMVAPFLGGLAGCLGMTDAGKIGEWPLGIALGTLATTFLVWIVVDPAIGLFEMLLPESRKHRANRLAQVRALREKRQEQRKRLLAEILTQEERDRCQWEPVLQPYAEKLARLLAKCETGDKQAENKAVDIGANAWQMGGLSCMRQLHSMTTNMCKEKYHDANIIDYISFWWDGIGSWRNTSLG